MGNETFTWVINNFSSLQSKSILSDKFVIGGCKWYLVAYPNGEHIYYLSLYLVVATFKTLPCGWRRNTKCRLTVVNQLSHELSHQREVKIVVEVDVLQVIGKLDVSVSEESQEVTQPLKRIKLNDDVALVKESIDVNGFQVLPSQAESVKHIFKRHPDMALEFRAKNQHMRTSCINLLLNIIETLCQSLQDLSIDDLSQAEKALTYLKDSGFKVDWLEPKLEEVKDKKIQEQFGKTRMQELEEKLKVSKQKCLVREALLEKEKTKVFAAARAPPLTLDDVV